MTDLNAEYRDWLGQADGGSGLIQDAGTGRRERFNQAASAVLRVRWVRRLLAAVVPLIVLGAGAALVPVWPTAARVELGLSVIFGPVLCFLVLYAVNCASPVWIIPLILVMLVLGGDGAAALPAAGSGHLIGASAMAAIIVGVAGVVLLGLTITGAVVTGERWQRQRQQSGHPVSHDVRIDSDWIWLAPRGPVDFSAIRMVPVLLAGITLITGVIMAGTGVMTIRDGQAMVAGLRAHGVVTPAIADNITTDQLQGGQDEPVTEVQVSFLVPGGRIALTDDTTFDGTYSVPPPKGTGETRAVVRYDPGNVNVFLRDDRGAPVLLADDRPDHCRHRAVRSGHEHGPAGVAAQAPPAAGTSLVGRGQIPQAADRLGDMPGGHRGPGGAAGTGRCPDRPARAGAGTDGGIVAGPHGGVVAPAVNASGAGSGGSPDAAKALRLLHWRRGWAWTAVGSLIGCSTVTDGILKQTGQDITWPGQVTLGRPFPVRTWPWPSRPGPG